MYLNADTKMHKKTAALNAVHHIPSKFLVTFSETTFRPHLRTIGPHTPTPHKPHLTPIYLSPHPHTATPHTSMSQNTTPPHL